MFNLFGKKRTAKEFVEEAKETHTVPKEEVKAEKPPTTYYRMGLTSDGRVSFSMGYSEITMNVAGINQMIQQLELFRDQIAVPEEKETNEGQPE